MAGMNQGRQYNYVRAAYQILQGHLDLVQVMKRLHSSLLTGQAGTDETNLARRLTRAMFAFALEMPHIR